MREITQEALDLVSSKAQEIRRNIITMLGESGSGHTGGSLSAADILACLYFWEMQVDPQRPDWEDRDRFVLSKGHAAPVLYAALAEKGFFPREQLGTLRKLGSALQGHPDMRKLAGVEASTGSLGQSVGGGGYGLAPGWIPNLIAYIPCWEMVMEMVHIWRTLSSG